MKLNLKKLSENALDVELKDGKALFKTVKFAPQADPSHKLMYVYGTDYEVTIEEGTIGILTAVEDIAVKSLIMPSSPTILTPGTHYVAGIMRTHTDAIPSIFVENEPVLQLVIVQTPLVDELNIEEYVAPVEEVAENDEEVLTVEAEEVINEAV